MSSTMKKELALQSAQDLTEPSRVQGMADANAIIATEAVVQDARAARLLEQNCLQPTARHAALRGIAREVMVYDIPYSG